MWGRVHLRTQLQVHGNEQVQPVVHVRRLVRKEHTERGGKARLTASSGSAVSGAGVASFPRSGLDPCSALLYGRIVDRRSPAGSTWRGSIRGPASYRFPKGDRRIVVLPQSCVQRRRSSHLEGGAPGGFEGWGDRRGG